jgi:hypothetical protein
MHDEPAARVARCIGETAWATRACAAEILTRAVDALARSSRSILGDEDAAMSEAAAFQRRLTAIRISVRTLCAFRHRAQASPTDRLMTDAMYVLAHGLAAQIAEARLALLGVYGNVRAELGVSAAGLGALPPQYSELQNGDTLVNEMAAHLGASERFKAAVVTRFAASRGLPSAPEPRRD